MLMNETAAFDAVAAEYDKKFSETLVGKEQRKISRQWLEKVLHASKLQILEINCGTGDDALWLGSLGHDVIATDQSMAMINEAKDKLSLSGLQNVQFMPCDFKNLIGSFGNKKFDLIFSNFAGLNCVAPGEMIVLAEQLSSLLTKEGELAIVVFGKHSWWETFFFLLKGQPGNAFRRWRNGNVSVKLADNVYQPVYYYSVKQLQAMLSPLKLVDKKPIGLFIPPSYLEAAMEKRRRLFKSLTSLEKRINGAAVTSSFADHVFLLFKK